MQGSDIAARRDKGNLADRITDAVGPAGVFFRGFLRNPRMVGAIFQSSRATVDAMLEPVDWSRCKLFVEYGPGVGTFTRPVLERLPRDGELLVIDTNPLFTDYLRRNIRDSRFHAVLGSAADVESIIGMIGHEGADYVLSGLPFSTLPDGVGPAIAAATARLVRPGGAFMTYQYSNSARDLTAQHFPRVDSALVKSNIPPCKLAWGWQD